jgi:cell division protein ZapA
MSANQNIKIFIAGRPYMLGVERDGEEVVRKAAEHLNETIKHYSESFEYKDQQDLFAMVALQAVANSLKIEQEKSFKDSKLEIKLSELDVMLTKHLEMVE